MRQKMQTTTHASTSGIYRRWLPLLALITLVSGACLLQPPAALASTPSPAWEITSISAPTNFAPGSTNSSSADQYMVTATNGGGSPAGGPITISDTLPAGVTPDPAGAHETDEALNFFGASSCSSAGQTVTCIDPYTEQPGWWVQIVIPVDVSASASGSITNVASVTSGGAAPASTSEQTSVTSTAPAFSYLEGAAGLSAAITNADGTPDTQAGSHPYGLSVSTAFSNLNLANGGDIRPAGAVKDLKVNLPAGVVVDPNATIRCTEAELESDQTGGGCPPASQIGTITLTVSLNALNTITSPLYNMVPPSGAPAEFGFDAVGLGVYVHLVGSVRTGSDYGLSATSNDILAKVTVDAIQANLWGSPSDPSHDTDRCTQSGSLTPGSCPVPRTAIPLLTMPSACSGPLTTTVSADSWENPGSFVSDATATADSSGNPVGVTGCDQLDFTPSISLQPDTTAADSPSGLSVDLSLPQNESVGTLAEANLKDATVTLPQGMSVNPSAANGLAACTPAEIGIDNANAPTCPDASKIGTVEVDTPLLPDPLTGGIYFAQQTQNPFGSLLAIYLTAYADGVWIKLAGHVVPDPVTGQLTTTFSNNPQLPFTDFKLDFFGGPQGVLATPDQCGTYTTTSSLSPWSGTPAVTSSDPFPIDSGCVSGFSPSFTAGTQNAQAGAFSPFVLSFERSDNDQYLSGLDVKLPPGMLAKLAGVQECSDQQLASISSQPGTGAAQAANPSCPAGSQVGTVTTGAGPGPDPFFLSGKVYLTGSYKGAPYGLAVVVPVLAGPLDLGTVVVRQALYIDPTTAQVTAVSDPFPTILDGIPLRIRRIDVNLDRPGFTVNPTSCNPMAVTGTLTSTLGLTAPVSSRFQVGGCQELGFSPKLHMKLTGKGRTRSGDHPTLTATLTQPGGEANIHTARVALPLSLALDPNNSQHVCNYATAAAVHGGSVGCPSSTIVGQATAVTPLLSQPLSGPVYLVQGIRCAKGQPTVQGTCASGTAIHTLPSLLVPLRGQIALDLRAQSSTAGGKLVTTFSTIPDAAVSKFVLQINGGRNGILVVTGRGRSVCTKKQVANARFGAQSGKASGENPKLATPACGKPAHLRVLSHKVQGRSLILRVRASERGRLTVTGPGLKRLRRVLKAGVHTVRVAMTNGASASRVVQVKVTLQPANARPATRTFRMRE